MAQVARCTVYAEHIRKDVSTHMRLEAGMSKAGMSNAATSRIAITTHKKTQLPAKEETENDHAVRYYDLRDRRVVIFWLLQLTGHASFAVWLVVAAIVSESPLSRGFKTSRLKPGLPPMSDTSAPWIDVWFALSLPAAVDAVSVVATFNGALIRRFHYAASQRMIVLASMLSAIVLLRNSIAASTAAWVVALWALVSAIYMLFSLFLDRFDKPAPLEGCFRRNTLSQYSSRLNLLKTTWRRALLHTVIVLAFGLLLSSFVPSAWSPIVPVFQILFESLFLSSIKATKTSRFLLLCSPPFFASVFVHWGAILISSPRLGIAAWHFAALVLLARLLLDLHLHTILRARRDLSWARAQVLVSTPRLLVALMLMLVLEYLGVRVITYIKPITVLALFGVGNTAFITLAAYNIAMRGPSRR